MSYPMVMNETRRQMMIRLPAKLHDAVQAEADRTYRSASSQVVAIIAEWFERRSAERPQ